MISSHEIVNSRWARPSGRTIAFISILAACFLILQGCSPSVMPSETGPEIRTENGIPQISLSSGFQPDPFTYDLRAGGPVETNTDSFTGYLPASPSAILEFSPDKYPLTIILRSESDNVMMLRTPDGQIRYNDDFDGLNAGFTIYEPQEGAYEIFAGLLNDAMPVPAELSITEIYAPNRPAPVISPDTEQAPMAGTTSLQAGFSPDPFVEEISLETGYSFGSEYEGFFSEAPTFSLNYTAGEESLTIISESDESDTVLLVYSPDQQWQYNDDFDRLNAGVRFDAPVSGEYLIWAGTYDGSTSFGHLLISEDFVPQSERYPDISLAPEYERIRLSAGFEPDPVQHEAFLMGGMEYADFSGFFSEAPSFAVDYEAGDVPLTFLSDSYDDTVILIYAPDGEWYYNDDFEELNAGVYFEAPQTGEYLIWMGSYENDGIEAMLEISESYSPPSERMPDTSGAAGEQLAFTPGQSEPFTREIVPLVSIELSDIGTGYVAEQPDFAVDIANANAQLALSVTGEIDTTLLVYTPSGEWLFNDDFDELNPAIRLEDPEAGTYLIWVGKYLSMGAGDETAEVSFRIE
jgi:serine protease Do